MDKDASAGEEYFDQTDGYRLWEATENAGCTGSECDYAVELHLAESLISMPNNMSVLEGAHYLVCVIPFLSCGSLPYSLVYGTDMDRGSGRDVLRAERERVWPSKIH